MNILYLTEYFPENPEKTELTGGTEARCFYLAKELAKKHNITILTTTQKNPRTQNFKNIRIIRPIKLPYAHTDHILKRLLNMHKMYKAGKKIIKNIDIIDAHNFVSYIPATMLAKKYKKKSFAQYHEVWLNNWIKNTGTSLGIIGEIGERIALKLQKNTKLITVSNFTKSKLKNKHTKTIHNGIELNKYKKIKGEKFTNPTICRAGRLTPLKRTQDLILATKIIKNKIPNIRIKIIGDGKEKQKLIKLTKKLKLEKNIEFLGFLKDHNEVLKIIKKSHIFCLPSILEGFGIVTVEALALNTPYISSDIPPTREITQGKGGLLYQPKNYKELANKTISLLTNKTLYKQKQKETEQLAKKYDWKDLAKQLEEEYIKWKI